MNLGLVRVTMGGEQWHSKSPATGVDVFGGGAAGLLTLEPTIYIFRIKDYLF